MTSTAQYVDTAEKLQNLIDHIPLSDTGPPSLFVDLEGQKLSRHGTLDILTVLVEPINKVYLVDVTTLGTAAFTTTAKEGRTLKAILESPNVKKVFFDIRRDCDALFSLYGVSVAAIFDLQLMELASRLSGKHNLNGLARCIEQDAGLPYQERQAWQAVKHQGMGLFSPAHGGSYAVFATRPLPDILQQYCAQDVTLMPRLFDIYRLRLCDAWWARIDQETTARITLAQSASFDPNARNMAEGPREWNGWRPTSGQMGKMTRSTLYAPSVWPLQTVAAPPSTAIAHPYPSGDAEMNIYVEQKRPET